MIVVKPKNQEFLRQTERYLVAKELVEDLQALPQLNDTDKKLIERNSKIIEEYENSYKTTMFQDNKQMEQVLEWSKTFSLPIGEEVQLITPRRSAFCLSLITSELNELISSLKDFETKYPNLTEEDLITHFSKISDDMVDTIWVIFRKQMEWGIHSIFAEIFTAVFEANMSKACSTEEEAQATVDFYMEEKGIETYYVPSNGQFVVHASKDYPELEIAKDKVLKNKNWKKPDDRIREIVEKALKNKVS